MSVRGGLAAPREPALGDLHEAARGEGYDGVDRGLEGIDTDADGNGQREEAPEELDEGRGAPEELDEHARRERDHPRAGQAHEGDAEAKGETEGQRRRRHLECAEETPQEEVGISPD